MAMNADLSSATPPIAARRRIKLTLEYDGSNFYGWQVQARSHERTVQGVIEQALRDIPGAIAKVHAAGRTDAGVHALAMVAHYNSNDRIPPERLVDALNARLPADVRVLAAEQVAPDFEAQFSCCYRRYLYCMRLLNGQPRGLSFTRQRVLQLRQRLDIAAMQAAAPYFEGERDFAALATQETRTSVRTVYLCRLEHHPAVCGDRLELHIAANGFLRNMVRAIVGTLLYVGEGKVRPEDIPEILASLERRRAGPNVAPQGLYFVQASYQPWPRGQAQAEDILACFDQT